METFPSTAIAFEGGHGQLLKIRSLYMTGWSYRTVVVDGQEQLKEFPFERYVGRPSRSWNTWQGPRDEVPFTLADLRRQLAEIPARPADSENPESQEP
jgi:hypothetical protein